MHGLECHLAQPALIGSNNALVVDPWLTARLVAGLLSLALEISL